MKNGIKKVFLTLTSLCMLAGCGSSSAAAASTSAAASEPAETTAAATDAAETTAAAAATDGTVTITDHADRTVTVPTDPQSVVVTSILPLASVLTIYLDSPDTIKAMEPASMRAAENGILSELYPSITNITTDIMDGDDVNVESVVALNPDIVYVNANSPQEIEKMENAGLTVVAVSPTKWNFDCIKTYDEWIALLDQIYPSRATGRETTVDEYSNKIYDEIQAKVADIADEDKQKVLFLFQYDENTMVTSGKKFFGQWWCDAVGAKNAAESVEASLSNATITMEQVYEWNPDVIIITNFTPTQPDDLYNNAIGDDDWSTVKAVQDKRVYKMPLGSYRTYTPGVDTPMTLEWLAQAVYPDLFDYDVTSDVKDYYKTLYGIELTDEQIHNMYNPNSAATAW